MPSWKFNQQVADIFSEHVRQHIPDYDRVLDQMIDICKQKLIKESPILEIGCAVGETVNRLYDCGFRNIHAVDNSQDMLDRCPSDRATYYCSNNYPDIKLKFDAALANWTLHFIKNKKSYLSAIYENLSQGGFVFLSEKTSNSGMSLEQYHIYKSRCGVSDVEIKSKAESLKGVMFPKNIEWYLRTLKNLGFSDVSVVNANWCFTSFVAIK